MKAYKCDRCGKLFEKFDKLNESYKIFYYVTTNRYSTGKALDICKDCQDEFQAWMTIYSKDE